MGRAVCFLSTPPTACLKFEIRSPKRETNPIMKYGRVQKGQQWDSSSFGIRNLNLLRISDFEFLGPMSLLTVAVTAVIRWEFEQHPITYDSDQARPGDSYR